MDVSRQTRAEPLPENTTSSTTLDVDQPTAAMPSSQDQTEQVTEQIAALSLVGTNRSDLVEKLVEAGETLTGRIDIEQETAETRSRALGESSGGQELQAALMTKSDTVMLSIDRSLGQMGGGSKNFFAWLWTAIAVDPWKFLSARSGNQRGFLCMKAF